MWNIVKIVIGILLIVGALNNLRLADGRDTAQLLGYLTATALFFIIGVYLLYSAYKSSRK